jgi:hypothetical protein
VEGGIPAVLIYEDLEFLSPYMHSALDIVGTSLNHAAHFEANARLGAAAVADLAGPFEVSGDARFRRQDANDDGTVDLSDAISLLQFLFLGGPAPFCDDAADANDDGKVDIGDAVTVLFRLFQGSAPIPEPAESCGPDPTGDPIGCVAFPPCAAQ